MNCISHKVAVITATLVSGLAVLNSNLAHAAIITSEFDVNVTSGPLAGNTYSGLVSYDDTIDGNSIGFSASPFFPASDIEFTFNGITYTEEDRNPRFVVVDRGGSIVGLDWSISDNRFRLFDFKPSFGSANSFEYFFPVAGVRERGDGNVVFSSLTPPKPIPELTKYTFTVGGFSGGGTLSGMFEGVDLNNDGLLVGDNLINGVEVYEISNFIAEFTGDSLIPDLEFKQEFGFQTGWNLLPDGTLSLDYFDIGNSEGFIGADLNSGDSQLVVGTPDNQVSFVVPGEVLAKPVIVPESVPEPGTVGGLLVLSLGWFLKKQKA